MSASRSPRARPSRSGIQPLHVILGVVLLGALGALWVVMQPDRERDLFEREGGKEAPAAAAEARTTKESAPQDAEVRPLDHPAMRKLRYFRSAVENYNVAALQDQLDVAAWYQRESGPSAPRWTAVPRRDRDAFEEELASRLTESEELRLLAANEPTGARLVQEGDEELVFEVRSEPLPDWSWTVRFRQPDAGWKIAGITGAEAAPEPVAADSGETGADAEPQTAEEKFVAEHFIELDDQGARIFKGEVAEVEYVEGTTGEEVAQLQGYLNDFLGDDSLARKRAREEMEYNRHKVIPAILNWIVERPLTSEPERIRELTELSALLEQLTLRDTTWPVPGMTTLESDEELRELRTLSLEGWFGWWGYYGQRWEVWKEKAGIPEPDPRRRRRR